MSRTPLRAPPRVTGFFRDRAVFDALGSAVLPRAAGEAGTRAPFRAWAAGTATGEEAYSLAMLGLAAGARVEVVGTDVDEAALELARRGVYRAIAASAVPPALRRRYLAPAGPGLVRVDERVRARVQFARHDLLGPRLAPAAAIVAAFDLVLCRNVLIHLDAHARARVVLRLASALATDGALVLGLDEVLPAEALRLFEAHPAVDAELKVFRRAPEGD